MFQKGVSGNPGGKRKKSEAQLMFEARCREYMNTKGLKKLTDMADSDDSRNICFALEKMMAYGWGKPAETLDVTNYDGADERQDADIVGEVEAAISGSAGEIGSESSGSEAPPTQ